MTDPFTPHMFIRVPAEYTPNGYPLWRCSVCGLERRGIEVPQTSGDRCPGRVPSADEGIEATLSERGSRYGKFTVHARITQDLKRVMQYTPNWSKLEVDQKEALEMVAHKIGRILNGDPNYADSWVDIEGYVHLVTKRLMTGEEK